MQKRSFCLIAYLFLCTVSSAQPHPDSAWFENYFIRMTTARESNVPSTYDSLEIVKEELADKKSYAPALARYYIEKAAWFLSKKKIDSAISSFKTAISLANKAGLSKEEGNGYLGLANLYQFTGNTIDAAQNYLPAVKLFKDRGRKRALVGLYRNLYAIQNKLQQKNIVLQNMMTAIATGKSNESDLVSIINTRNSEDEGLYFPDQSLVKEVGADMIYVIFGNAKFVVTGQDLGSYGSFRDIHRIPAGTISSIPDFPKNGSIVMELSGDPKVYMVKDTLLYHITNTDVLETYGGWDAVYFLPSGALSNFPKSGIMVTMDNRNTIFNISQEFDILTDSIESALKKNVFLSNELSREVADRNNILQKRKLLLWVSGIGLLALLIIILLLARNFRQKQKVLKAEEELRSKMALEKERTRIATDMHDDLGAGLSRIKFLSETIGMKKQQQLPVEEEIMNIREYSHEMIDKMGEIVWALNEKNDSLNDLLSYTRSYAVEYLSQNGIQCTVNIPDQVPEYSVSGEFRRNIYLSVKEALHNIVKHAQAQHVRINIEAGKNISIFINDDGIGYKGNNKPYSNGIGNMKQRMENINGEFGIENKNGTTVMLSAPVIT